MTRNGFASIMSIVFMALIALALVFGSVLDATAALTAGRTTSARIGAQVSMGVAAGKKIYSGALVARDSGGYATPGAVSSTIIGIGRAEETVDNTAGDNGTLTIRVSKGTFQYGNYSGDPITIADIGYICYIYDDYRVAKTSNGGTRGVAGRIFDVDSSGVWVQFDFAAAPSTITSAEISNGAIVDADVNDNASIAGTKILGPVYRVMTVTTDSTTDNVTYSAASLIGGLVLRNGNDNRTDTTPAASAIVSAITNAKAGTSFEFEIRNTDPAANTITLAAGSGVTLSGTMTIAQNYTRRFVAVITNVGTPAVTIYSLGTVVH